MNARDAAIQAVKDHPSTTFMAPYESLADAVLAAAEPLIRAEVTRANAAKLLDERRAHAPRAMFCAGINHSASLLTQWADQAGEQGSRASCRTCGKPAIRFTYTDRDGDGWVHEREGDEVPVGGDHAAVPVAGPGEKDTASRGESTPEFFQVDHTYTRQNHGDTAEFQVRSIDTHPDHGGPVAFGWYRRQPRTTWHAYSSCDYLDGWTDTTTRDSK